MSMQALLLLDLQNEIVHPEGKLGQHDLAAQAERRGVLGNAEGVLEAFRARHLKVAHVRLAFRPVGGELVVNKQCVNPFFSTGLHARLARHAVRELVLCGVATNLVVESAARFADDAGFAVTVIEDCCASVNEEMHQFSVSKILPMFGRITSASECRKAL